MLIRELPPLRLHVTVDTPSGGKHRWAPDARNPDNVMEGLSFSTSMPGGFEQCSVTLERRPEFTFSDLDEMSDLRVRGAGGKVAWEGRLETTPRQSGDQETIQPSAVGWQAHLGDDSSARMIYVDTDMSKWQPASVQRKINLIGSSVDLEDPGGAPDWSTGQPALQQQLTGPWSRLHYCEAWYDAQGIPLGQVYYGWKTILNLSGDPSWGWDVGLSNDDTASAYDITASLIAAGPSSGSIAATTAGRKFAFTQLYYGAAGGGNGVVYSIFWTALAVYGNHGLTLRGTPTLTTTPGLLASDVIAHALANWAPKLAFTADTIVPSTFYIPHLVFTDPGTAADIITGATAFDLQDWAVWENRTFYFNPRNTRGRKWRARVAQSKLAQAGPQIDRIWNGVIVKYSDVLGKSRTVGPIGSGANIEDTSLSDPDPLNPATVAGVRRWTTVQMNTGTPASAIKIGAMFLAQTKLISTAGNATIAGFVEDEGNNLWPAWAVRAGDQIAFVDAADPSYRRVVKTSYDDTSKINSVSLDAPPDGMQELLARLTVSLSGTGFS